MQTKRRKKRPAAKNWRASWKGDLHFGLVTFAVEAINAHSPSGSDVHFHQLHAECDSRIEYRKVCPLHGEVSQDEIVLGYEYSRGKYVEIDPEELDAIRTKEERALRIEEFIDPAQLDDIYLDGRMYYLVPVAVHDREPFHLLRTVLEDDERIGIGQVVFSGKEQLAAVMPHEGALVMAMLNYAPELRDPDSMPGHGTPSMSAKNLKLARQLIHAMTARHFQIDKYEDRYRDRVLDLIEKKRKGKKVVVPEEEEEEPVINLMEALRRSLPHGSRASKSSGHKHHRRTSAS